MAQPKVHRKGFMFVLSSPSGAGKTTLSRLLLQKDDNLIMSVSVTTRPKRKGETEGKDYTFVDTAQFARMVEEEAFLEHAVVFGNFYGTPASVVEKHLAQGTDVLFDIDWQGTQQLTAKHREDMVSVFILPPSMKELESRLRKRAQDTEDIIGKRMAKANSEISHWTSYDYVIINNDIEKSLETVHSILQAERQRRERQQGLKSFVKELLV